MRQAQLLARGAVHGREAYPGAGLGFESLAKLRERRVRAGLYQASHDCKLGRSDFGRCAAAARPGMSRATGAVASKQVLNESAANLEAPGELALRPLACEVSLKDALAQIERVSPHSLFAGKGKEAAEDFCQGK